MSDTSATIAVLIMLVGAILSAGIFFAGILIGYRMGIKTVRQDQTPLFDGAFRTDNDITDTE